MIITINFTRSRSIIYRGLQVKVFFLFFGNSVNYYWSNTEYITQCSQSGAEAPRWPCLQYKLAPQAVVSS